MHKRIQIYFLFSLRNTTATEAPGDSAKKWGKLSIADALKNARGVPRIIKSGAAAAGRRSPEVSGQQRPVQHSSSEEPGGPVSLSRVSSKREKYLKVSIITTINNSIKLSLQQMYKHTHGFSFHLRYHRFHRAFDSVLNVHKLSPVKYKLSSAKCKLLSFKCYQLSAAQRGLLSRKMLQKLPEKNV